MPRGVPTIAAALLVVGAGAAAVYAQPQPQTFFKQRVKLSASEIQTIDHGQVVTKVLDSGDTYQTLPGDFQSTCFWRLATSKICTSQSPGLQLWSPLTLNCCTAR